MFGDERLELAGQLGVTTGGQFDLDPLLERGKTQLAQTRDR